MRRLLHLFSTFFFFNDTATTEIYTLSLHDALPIFRPLGLDVGRTIARLEPDRERGAAKPLLHRGADIGRCGRDRKSTRLNSSHANISYAVFCLKKKINSVRVNISSSAVSLHRTKHP